MDKPVIPMSTGLQQYFEQNPFIALLEVITRPMVSVMDPDGDELMIFLDGEPCPEAEYADLIRGEVLAILFEQRADGAWQVQWDDVHDCAKAEIRQGLVEVVRVGRAG